jgi:hypothetical protein
MKRLVTYLLLTTLKRLLTTLILLSVTAYMSGSRGAEVSAESIWKLNDDGSKIAEQNVWHRVTPSPETSRLLARQFETAGK